jgi:hypothetical protein
MTAPSGKEGKKQADRRTNQAVRQENMRYNQMMYGPTAGEGRPAARKSAYGAAYLGHPKFQALLTAFRKGVAAQFDITDKGKVLTIATDGSQISFAGRVLFYSRPLNRHEDNLLLDREAVVQGQGLEPLVHLVFAVIRAFPELEAPPLTYLNREFQLGLEPLEAGIPTQGPNLLLGAYKHSKVQERARG